MPKKPSLVDQPDFFISAITDLPLRDQREIMERPFFSLNKNKRTKPINYLSPDQSVYVDVSANPEHGMATIWDADILIWAASTLNHLKNQGTNDLPRTLHFHYYDILKSIGRETGGRQYKALQAALARLQSTTIATNIRAENGKERLRQFSWIDSWDDHLTEKKQSKGMSITLSDWFYEGVVMEGGLLKIDPEYFSIKGGWERWLYRTARKHVGDNKNRKFIINFSTLFEKSGSEGPYRIFKFKILKIIERNELPQYNLKMIDGEKKPQLQIKKRNEVQEKSKNDRLNLNGSILTSPWPLTNLSITMFRAEFPNDDLDDIKEKFDNWLRKNPARTPDNYQSAFLGFARKHLGAFDQ